MKCGRWSGSVVGVGLAMLLFSAAAPREASGRVSGGSASTPPAPSARLFGKITHETRVVAGARVLAYRSFADLLARRSEAVSEPSGTDGGFLLALPAGTYHLAARAPAGSPEGPVPVGGLFAFHGSNPFTLMPDTATEINFSLARKVAEAVVTPAKDTGSGTINGVVTSEGKGIAGVQVRLYLDAESAFRGMGYAAAPPTDENGSFSFDFLPESAYYVVARKRAAGTGPGPLAEGDYFGYYIDNPVQVHVGSTTGIALELVVKGREVGNADGRPRPSGTRIAGRITDAAGAAVRGVYAFAYDEKVMAHRKPAFISQPVDDQGRYVIQLSGGGTFYIGARSAYGDSPGKGEWYGRYDGTPDHGVTVGEGESAEAIDIRVERILE